MHGSYSAQSRSTFLWGIGLLTPIAFVQVFIITAGWHDWPRETNYVARQSQAFLHGQLSLLTKPRRELLTMPNPFDPAKNFKAILVDALLYQGKYYLYWGPTPAILIAAICQPLGQTNPDFGDEFLAFGFLFGTVVLATILILRIKNRWFDSLTTRAAAPAILSLGIGAPVLYALARPAIYEEAIAAGQFFLLAGFCALLKFSHKRNALWLWITGILWALSLASRVSLLPGIVAAELVVIWHIRAWRSHAVSALLIPLTVALLLLGWFNFARFHSFTEFGLRWQLAGMDQHLSPFSAFFSIAHIPVNAFRYLFAAPDWGHGFPFLRAARQEPWLAKHLQLSDTLFYDPLIGLVWIQPFVLLALAARIERRQGESMWIIAALAATQLAFASDLLFQWSAMRYLLDILPCLSILAAVGYFRCLQSMRPNARQIQWLVAAIVAVQIAIALPLGISGMYGNFKTHNEPLFNAMKSLFQS